MAGREGLGRRVSRFLAGLNQEPGTVEGVAVDADTVREVAFAAGSTWQRLVADPIKGYAMAQVSKSYAPPPRMARAVRDRDGVCRAPGCAIPAVRCQLDHVVEVRDGGTTRGDTIADGCERHHAKKTRRHWAARITPDGVVEWRLPDGRIYPTFPMDYREFGLHVDDPSDESAAPHAEPAGSKHPGDRPPRKILIDAEDLQAIDADAIAHPRELNRIRDELAAERAAHADTRAALTALKALGPKEPPF